MSTSDAKPTLDSAWLKEKLAEAGTPKDGDFFMHWTSNGVTTKGPSEKQLAPFKRHLINAVSVNKAKADILTAFVDMAIDIHEELLTGQYRHLGKHGLWRVIDESSQVYISSNPHRQPFLEKMRKAFEIIPSHLGIVGFEINYKNSPIGCMAIDVIYIWKDEGQ